MGIWCTYGFNSRQNVDFNFGWIFGMPISTIFKFCSIFFFFFVKTSFMKLFVTYNNIYIINIPSIIMTFVDLSFCMPLWGSKGTKTYPCVAMQNAVSIEVAMELKQNVVMPIVTNSNTFLPSI